MEFYCETSESKGVRDIPREKLVTKLSKDIKHILEVNPTSPLQPAKITIDL